jgi:tetratricopeptide (TPR) repeat protein
LTRSEISDLFSQAKRLFNEATGILATDPVRANALFEQSALYFERMVNEGGVRNGKLYYDIGNVYFRTGDIGRAILNYRRAERLIPNDPNLHQNLTYARTRRVDAIDRAERALVSRVLFFWYYDLSSQTRLLVFGISFSLVWIFASLKLLLGRRGFVWAAAAAALVAVVFLGSLAYESVDARRNPPAVVLAEEIVGRKGNSETYQPSFQAPLHAGTEVILREKRGSWLLVELQDGRRTWLPASTVEPV